MVVKEKRGRRRYVLFKIEGERLNVDRLRDLLQREIGRDAVKLIQFDGELGIIRCPLEAHKRIIETLNGMSMNGSRIITLRSSGTLKSLRERYPIGSE